MPRYKNTPFYISKNDPSEAFAIIAGRDEITNKVEILVVQVFPSDFIDNFGTIREFLNYLNGAVFEEKYLRLITRDNDSQWICHLAGHDEENSQVISAVARVTLEDHREAINMMQELAKTNPDAGNIPELLLAEG